MRESKGRTLHQNVTNKQNGNGRVVLDAREVQILLQSVESSLGKSISVEIVEEVHGPENWLPGVSYSHVWGDNE